MTDARHVCAELCEVSQLALYLARQGRDAGLHQVPLFSGPGAENGIPPRNMVREGMVRPWGTAGQPNEPHLSARGGEGHRDSQRKQPEQPRTCHANSVMDTNGHG